MKVILFILWSGLFYASHAQDGSVQCWAKLQKHCGKAFQGEIIAGMTDDFKDKQLVMHIRSCTPGEMRIPFMVGDNRSRTWVFTMTDSVMTLKHDHRHEDGHPDKVTWYGGTATNAGSSSMQVFPADEVTRRIIPAASGNVWWITIDDHYFTYNLRRLGSERLFTVRFDLTKPVAAPQAPWGWRD